MADHLSDADLVQRLMLLEKYKTAEAAAKYAGCRPAAFRSSVREAKRRGLTAKSKVMDEVAVLKTKLKMAEAELASVERVNIEASAIRQQIFDLNAETPDPPKWLTKLHPPKSSGVPCMLWSDWHHGEKVRPEQIGGANKFNRVVSEKRVQKLVTTSIDLAKNHMVMTKYPGAVIVLGGDMITGAIHEDLTETNDGSVQESCLEVQQMLIWALEQCARAFGKLLVVCVVGNHARGTPKPRNKNHVVMSHEWAIYCRLETWFANDRRIAFMIPKESDALFTVGNHRYLATHGDMLGVKGGDGIIGPIGPIARGVFKTKRQQAELGRPFDTLLCGHFHTRIPHSDAFPGIANGSLIGPSEYGHFGLRVPPSRPSQNLWFTHAKYGITAQWAVYLEDQANSLKLAPMKSWASWQGRFAA